MAPVCIPILPVGHSCTYHSIISSLNKTCETTWKSFSICKTTIVLLSFTKLLRTVTAVLSSTTSQYPDGQRVVWLYDGNYRYAEKGHLALFLFSLLFLLTIGFPYALLILTVQVFRLYSGYWFLRWVNKLMPIFDTYLGPYKPKQGYWTG